MTRFCVCGAWLPIFANLSAVSFPVSPTWGSTHWRGHWILTELSAWQGRSAGPGSSGLDQLNWGLVGLTGSRLCKWQVFQLDSWSTEGHQEPRGKWCRCCVSLVSTRKEARWSVQFFSLLTVENEGYVHQTNKQNWTLNSKEQKALRSHSIYTNQRWFWKGKQLERSWTVRSGIFYYFRDL